MTGLATYGGYVGHDDWGTAGHGDHVVVQCCASLAIW